MSIKLIMENWNKFLNEAVDKDGDGKVIPDWAKGEKPPKWADQDDDDPEVGDALSESEEDSIEEADEGAFAPNHYCIHHGGIKHEGRIVKAAAIRHTEPDKTGFVSHYDMKLPNGKVVENVAAEDIQVTNASLLNEHGSESAPGKRTHKGMKKKCNECGSPLNKEGKCTGCK